VECFSEPLESTQATTSLTSLRSGCTESVWTRAPGCIDSAQRGKPHPSADLLESSSSSSFNPCNHVFIPVVAGQGSPLRLSARAARVLRQDRCLFWTALISEGCPRAAHGALSYFYLDSTLLVGSRLFIMPLHFIESALRNGNPLSRSQNSNSVFLLRPSTTQGFAQVLRRLACRYLEPPLSCCISKILVWVQVEMRA